MALPRGLYRLSTVNGLGESGTAMRSMTFQGFFGLAPHFTYRIRGPESRKLAGILLGGPRRELRSVSMYPHACQTAALILQPGQIFALILVFERIRNPTLPLLSAHVPRQLVADDVYPVVGPRPQKDLMRIGRYEKAAIPC
jgi:hypothetical protein